VPSSGHGQICLVNSNPDQDKASGFTITRAYRTGNPRGVYGYPNIGAGYEWGRHAVRSFELVQVRNSGQPWSSVQWNAHGSIRPVYDIWLNKTQPANPLKLGQASGAEIMVWLNGGPRRPNVTIDGYRFSFFWWTVGRHGLTLPAIVFQSAQGDIHSFRGNLLPFMQYAASHVRGVSVNEWLAGIDFGYELGGNDVAGSWVRNFQLSGVSTAGYQARSFTSVAKATSNCTVRSGEYTVTGHAGAIVRVTRTVTESGYSYNHAATAARALSEARQAASAASWAQVGAVARANARKVALARLDSLIRPAVPKVTGLRQAVAASRLRAAGFGVRILTPYRYGRALIVSAQSLRAGTRVPRGHVISIRSVVR